MPAVAAVCQVATVLLTWHLWQHRGHPANLPIVEWLSRFGYGVPLVATALYSLVVPRIGAVAFLVVLAAAIAGDQTRIQPPVISLALLMALPALGDQGIRISRWHLTSLWLWAGLNKVLSSGWSPAASAFIASKLHLPHAFVLVAIPALEIGVGLTSLWSKSWELTRWGAVALHAGIFVTLTPLFVGWDQSVLPWNIALAFAAVVLFRQGVTSDSTARPYTMAAAVVLLVAPALFYAGRLDTYLSPNLFTSNTAVAEVCDQHDDCEPFALDVYRAVNVQLPPEARLFRRLFAKSCAPGTRLVVTGRATVLTDPPDHSTYRCPRRAG